VASTATTAGGVVNPAVAVRINVLPSAKVSEIAIFRDGAEVARGSAQGVTTMTAVLGEATFDRWRTAYMDKITFPQAGQFTYRIEVVGRGGTWTYEFPVISQEIGFSRGIIEKVSGNTSVRLSAMAFGGAEYPDKIDVTFPELGLSFGNLDKEVLTNGRVYYDRLKIHYKDYETLFAGRWRDAIMTAGEKTFKARLWFPVVN
jgi:hypothetical protein